MSYIPLLSTSVVVRTPGSEPRSPFASEVGASVQALTLRAGQETSAAALRRQFFPEEVGQQEQYRYNPGRAMTLESIASAISNAEVGVMRDLADLGRATIDVDPHLASCLSRRFGAIETCPWQVTPAQGDGLDKTRALKIAQVVERELVLLPAPWPMPEGLIGGVEALISDLTWGGLWDGRAADELVWGNRKPTESRPIEWAVERILWIHPRRLNYGPRRELRFVPQEQGMYYDPQGFYEVGVDVGEFPGKFVTWTPRQFGEYPEREGLNPRSLYWAFFKRFGARERMALTELYGKPWKIAEVDADTKVDPEELARLDRELQLLGQVTSLRMPKGVKLAVPNPAAGGNDLFSMTISEVNDEISKLILGQTMTTEDGSSRSQAQVHERQQDLLKQRDCRNISAVIKAQLVNRIVRANAKSLDLGNDEEVDAYTPGFRLVSESEPDRASERDSLATMATLGIPIPLDQVYELTGYRKPGDDEEVWVGVGPAVVAKPFESKAEAEKAQAEAEQQAKEQAQAEMDSTKAGAEATKASAEATKAESAQAAQAAQPPAGDGAQMNPFQFAFDPSQPRDEQGRWTSTGADLSPSDLLRPAAGAPPAFKLGHHVVALFGERQAPRTARIVRDVVSNNPVVSAFLSHHPLQAVRLSARAANQWDAAGLYDTGAVTLYASVGANRSESLRHEQAEQYDNPWGEKPYGFADAALSNDDRDERLFLHEVGHHLFATATPEARQAAEAQFLRTDPITVYGSTNPDEWIAESFAAYVADPGHLQERDPVGFSAVEGMLRDAGALEPSGQVRHLSAANVIADKTGDARDRLIANSVGPGGSVLVEWWSQILALSDDAQSLGQVRVRLERATLPRADFARVVMDARLRAAYMGAEHSAHEAGVQLSEDNQPILFGSFDRVADDFAARKVVTRQTFDTMTSLERRNAFTVAGLQEQTMLDAAHETLTDSIREGHSVGQFRDALNQRFTDAGWSPLNPWHVETVFRTNVMGAYAQGRKAQMLEVADSRPFGDGSL